MKVEVKTSFARQLKKIPSKTTQANALALLKQLEKATSIDEITKIKVMRNWYFSHRIQLDDYRIGVNFIAPDTLQIISILHRKDSYTKKNKR